MLTYKILDHSEYHLLDKFYDNSRAIRLDPMFSRVFAALEDGELVGFMVLQLVAHAEPIWIDPSKRGIGVWHGLAAMLIAYCDGSGIGGVYTQPTADRTKHMCEAAGWREMEHPLWFRIFDPELDAMLPGPIDQDDPTLAMTTGGK